MTTTMPGRMLALLALLQSRREWNGNELAERLGVTDRTVRRDIDRLRELGYAVDGTTGTAGGYRLASARNLPPLLLDDDEAVAVAVSLLTAAGGTVAGIEESSLRALAKLERILPARLRSRVETVGAATVSLVPAGGPRVDPAILAVLAAACRDHEIVTFDYQRRDGTRARRRVEPHSLVTGYGLWYLIAYEPERVDWRTFRLDRIEAPAPTRHRSDPRVLPATDPAAFLARSITTAPYRYQATATVRASADAVLARTRWVIPGRVVPLDVDSCSVALGADSLEQVAADLIACGAPFTVDGPAELREHLRTVAHRLLESTDAAP